MSSSSSRESSVEPESLQSLATSTAAENNIGSAQQPNSSERQRQQSFKSSGSSVRYLRACDNCRRRKVKCDGIRPACGHCTRVDAPCHYSIKPKSRRMWKCLETPGAASVPSSSTTTVPGHILNNENKTTLDDTTAKLLARVETMERLLMQRNGINPPRVAQPAIPADDSGQSSLFGSAGASTASGIMSLSMAASSALQKPAGSLATLDSQLGSNNSSSGSGAVSHSSVPAKRDLGCVTPDMSHGYAASSIDNGPMASSFAGNSTAVGLQQQQQQQQQQQSSGKHPDMQHAYSFGSWSQEVIADLIDTLFLSNCHITEIVHEETFRRQFAAGTLSPLLLYSALASAARYSKIPSVKTDPPYSASAPFINRAKALIVDAMDEPSLGNAQGLMILCMMHFSLGNEVATTFYKALALNMCVILGFNRLDSVNGPMQPQSHCGQELISVTAMSMSWVEREAARRLWWQIFSVENYSSTCMGLAPSIQAEYCDVCLPASTLEWTRGKPLQDINAEGGSSPKRSRIEQSPLQQLSAYHAQLSLIFSKVAWLVTRINTTPEDAVTQFGELNTILQRWYEGLPKELRISSVDTLLYGSENSIDYYHICVLHMRFYVTVIQLNHAIPEFTDDPSVIEPGQRKCVIAASRISDILRSSFEIPIEIRDMNWYMCVFRAAHIHIYRLLSRDTESIARAKQDLAIHRRHLREGGPLWRICHKLLNRLDDMEQMVMLLPAQIPVADLIRLKSLTKNGKSQLVNMQLDALIKPSLIQSEHGDSEDLPLLARAELANRNHNRINPSSNDLQAISGVQGISQGVCSAVDSICALAGPANGNMDPFASQLAASQLPGLSMGNCSTGSASFVTSSPSAASPPLALPALNSQMQQQQQQQPALHLGNDIQPINTNIVIDNNMAETLVNYFYMVASNQPATQQSIDQPGSKQSSQSQQGPTSDGSSTLTLSSPQQQIVGINSAAGNGLEQNGGSNGTVGGAGGPMLPSAASMMAQQQSFMQMKGGTSGIGGQQPTLFGQLYDPPGLKQLQNNHGSFV
ncbi:hypothetical protein GGI25_003437 [Coemansia spiralis]|uniref:Zn(2)-C6 fungal-type domain-containing protein n=2 Tax=Coemansia TaxID=4863 RepID=A0A9W8G626_9FUNG|nr:hypothetical protein EDC05_001696 [Coemansia umbellata]KAJ2621245.1 hypothetical protein GGI26_004318 [Coemansia sp. RSA 1358]KAJ2676792.1 hypothetical protein GGI25_003437 [Coemansia spiralis]